MLRPSSMSSPSVRLPSGESVDRSSRREEAHPRVRCGCRSGCERGRERKMCREGTQGRARAPRRHECMCDWIAMPDHPRVTSRRVTSRLRLRHPGRRIHPSIHPSVPNDTLQTRATIWTLFFVFKNLAPVPGFRRVDKTTRRSTTTRRRASSSGATPSVSSGVPGGISVRRRAGARVALGWARIIRLRRNRRS